MARLLITRFTSLLCFSLLLSAVSVNGIHAEEIARPPAPAQPSNLSVIEGFFEQNSGETLESATPVHPLTRHDVQLGDALAWYMKGRMQLERRELEAALESFEKAIHINPGSIDAYQVAIPLLMQKGRLEDAQKFALQAAVHSGKGIELVLSVAAIFASTDQLSESISMIRSALKLPSIKTGTVNELVMRRDLGLYLRLRNEIPEATVEYKYVFESVTDPDFGEDDFNKVLSQPGKFFDEFGDVFLKAEQPELALKAYEEASKHREAKPGLHSFNLATVFQKTGKPEAALDELQKYFDAKLQSRGRAAYELLDTLLTELGKQGELLSRLDQLLEADSKNDVLRFYIADVLLKAKNYARAEELYRSSGGTVSDPRAMVGMLSVLREKQAVAELLEVLTKAFRTVPRSEDDETLQRLAPDVQLLSKRFEEELTALNEDSDTLDKLMAHARTLEAGDEPALDFFTAYALGKISTDSERTEDAIHFYKYAIDMQNDPPGALFQELSQYLMGEEKYAEAIDILTQAVDHPSSQVQRERWYFLFYLSYAYEYSGETDLAVDAIREAQRLNKEPRLLFQEAWVFYHARQWDEALKIFNQVVMQNKNRRDPRSIELVQDAMFRISNIYVEQGDKPKGEEILQEVLKDDPDNTQANNDLGYLWAEQNKNLDQAKLMIEKAIKADPDNPAYQDSMGWVLYQQGEYEKAHEYLDKAVQHENGEDSTLYDHLGDCLNKLNRLSEARDIWEKALKLEEEKKQPGEKLVKSLKEKIKAIE